MKYKLKCDLSFAKKGAEAVQTNNAVENNDSDCLGSGPSDVMSDNELRRLIIKGGVEETTNIKYILTRDLPFAQAGDPILNTKYKPLDNGVNDICIVENTLYSYLDDYIKIGNRETLCKKDWIKEVEE